jgi:hypothetical protein
LIFLFIIIFLFIFPRGYHTVRGPWRLRVDEEEDEEEE